VRFVRRFNSIACDSRPMDLIDRLCLYNDGKGGGGYFTDETIINFNWGIFKRARR
jgi:hypothetical protein